jgi:Rod binding domain-containing protein
VIPSFPFVNDGRADGTVGNPKPSERLTSKWNFEVQDQKLRRAATEFESILISTLWRSMKGSFDFDDSDSTDQGGSGFEDMAIQSMSQALSKSGGFGLGKLIIKHLEPYLEDQGQRQSQSVPKP